MFKLSVVWEVPFLLASLVIEEMDISERDNAHAEGGERRTSFQMVSFLACSESHPTISNMQTDLMACNYILPSERL